VVEVNRTGKAENQNGGQHDAHGRAFSRQGKLNANIENGTSE
jgi:hypothetical protein